MTDPRVLEERIRKQKEKLELIDQRIGVMMSKRAHEEERLADLYKQARGLEQPS
jgi:hypothetical protein